MVLPAGEVATRHPANSVHKADLPQQPPAEQKTKFDSAVADAGAPQFNAKPVKQDNPKDQPSSSNSRSPEDASNGADAAKALTDKNNPYFDDPLLRKTDPTYNAQTARAQAFAATLYDYEQKGDNANIAQLLQTLGPDQAAKYLSGAGALQGQQFNKDGKAFDVDPVLGKALSAPGVQLGDPTQKGTLGYSLLQEAGQSGSNASSIAGILNASGTSPQVEALKNTFLDQILVNGKALGSPTYDQAAYANAARTVINGDPALLSKYPDGIGVQQIFGSPPSNIGFLNGLNREIDFDRYGPAGKPGVDPATGPITNNTMYNVEQWLAGKVGNEGEPPSERLQNMMSVLGADRTYAVLSRMTADQVKQLGIQDSLNSLTQNGQFTADDAKALALAQTKAATSTSDAAFDFTELGSAGSFIASLPNSPNGTAVKTAYAEGSISGVQELAQGIASGEYSGQTLKQVTATINSLSDNAANAISKAPVQVKTQLFSKLHATATQFANRGDGKEADALNAYAASLLTSGSPGDQQQIAATLRAMGGVGANGTIDPSSDLAKFLQSALRGQASFGFGISDLTPNFDIPKGVTGLLNGIAASGDTKLMAGTLDTVMQWTKNNPKQAEAIAAQDTSDSGTGYRKALTNLLDKSFNQFIALNPADPNATLVRTMQPQTIADLQVLSAIAMGPPYNSKIAGDFASVIGKHATQFAAYAGGMTTKDPELDSLLAGGGDQRHSAAVIFGQVMNSFGAGLNQSQAGLRAQATETDRAEEMKDMETRIVTDFLRGAGTFLLLASAWVSGGSSIPIGLGVAANGEKLASIFGRVGLFSGSVGTAVLDIAAHGDMGDEQKALQAVEQGMQAADLKPTQAIQQLYNGWFSNISQLPGGEGQKLTYGVMDGSTFPGAALITTDVQDFYRNYNPLGYYHEAMGRYPAVS